MSKTRTEKDALGEIEVPQAALYGASTARAVQNFQISGVRVPLEFHHAIAQIKQAAARANFELGLLDRKTSQLIEKAARAVARGEYDEHLVVDVFQTGSGTSTNMNVNEVVANVANLSQKEALGSKRPVHPNDHVNLGQSSNDVFPTALHVVLASMVENELRPALTGLTKSLDKRAREFQKIVKVGRTHLQDAVPLSLGQEFSGYTTQVGKGLERLESIRKNLFELPIGGTAVGTGINSSKGFGKKIVLHLRKHYTLSFTEAKNHFEAQAARDASVELSGALKTIAVSLIKIASDIRLMASGPRCGIGELALPSVQPGSSIMPGKSNPVIIESLLQVCVQVMGVDATVTWAAAMGQFELNAMMPVIGFNLFNAIRWLSNAVRNFDERAIQGLGVDRKKIESDFEKNIMMVTALVPEIGYEKAVEIAQSAQKGTRTIREILKEKMAEADVDRIFASFSDPATRR